MVFCRRLWSKLISAFSVRYCASSYHRYSDMLDWLWFGEPEQVCMCLCVCVSYVAKAKITQTGANAERVQYSLHFKAGAAGWALCLTDSTPTCSAR
jgi:hypothetical protein